MAKSLKTSQSCSARHDCPLIRLTLNKRKNKFHLVESTSILPFLLNAARLDVN